jgi:sigma-B regulation protein RsbU (phosphoserine phosphatase)
VAEVKLELRRPDGSTLPVMVNLAQRAWRGATILYIAVFSAEDRHKYERELLLQRRRAEELAAQHARDQEALGKAHAEAKDRALYAEQMMGIVSHDLRNPLSTIHMGAVLLSRTAATPQQLTVLGRIKRATERANRLITDLLDFTQARLGTGLKVWPRSIDLHQLVDETVDELAQAFQGRGLRHESSGQGECIADPDRVAQVVGNLVGNAMAYGEPAAPVTVTTTIAAEGCSIEVHNRGTSIPPEKLATIFQPLQRGHGSSGDTSVGLGLYIVEQVARAHGGEVQVTSGEAEGTTFRVWLPRGSAPAAAG